MENSRAQTPDSISSQIESSPRPKQLPNMNINHPSHIGSIMPPTASFDKQQLQQSQPVYHQEANLNQSIQYPQQQTQTQQISQLPQQQSQQPQYPSYNQQQQQGQPPSQFYPPQQQAPKQQGYMGQQYATAQLPNIQVNFKT